MTSSAVFTVMVGQYQCENDILKTRFFNLAMLLSSYLSPSMVGKEVVIAV
jgi:hypothetical protein